MPITRTLAAMRVELAKQASIDTDDTGGTFARHPTAWVNIVLNDAFRSYRSFITQHHYQLYKLATTAAALPTTPSVTGELFAEIPWPSTAVDVLGIDVLTQAELGWRKLEPVEWEERRMFDPAPFLAEGVYAPYAFSTVSEGTVSGSTFTAGSIALFPLPRGGTYKTWYLPEWVDITTDGHLFLFPDEDGAQWVLWEATRRIAARDNDSNNRLAEAARQLNPLMPDTVAGRIVKSAPKKVKAGPKTIRRSADY
jgi:hypothetical protein